MSDQPVEREDVRHVASLARIGLDEEEVDLFVDQFVEILDYFEKLDDVPDVEREENLVNVMRSDEVRPSLDREDALLNAPETEDGYVKGPRIS